MPIVLYFVGKWFVYSAWCYIGIRLFGSPVVLAEPQGSLLLSESIPHRLNEATKTPSIGQALRVGALRMIIGVLCGGAATLVGYFLLAGVADSFDQGVLRYVIFLTPVRGLEWWLTSKIIDRSSRGASVRMWIFGGIVLSFLGDALVGFALTNILAGLC